MRTTIRRWTVLWLAPFAVIALMLGLAAPSSAAITAWTPWKYVTDCAGNGCLTLQYANDTDGQGMLLEGVHISAGGGLNFDGIDGKDLKCWNGAGTTLFFKDGTQTNLNKNEDRKWWPDDVWAGATEIHCGWTHTDVYIVGSPSPGLYTKVNAYNNSGA